MVSHFSSPLYRHECLLHAFLFFAARYLHGVLKPVVGVLRLPPPATNAYSPSRTPSPHLPSNIRLLLCACFWPSMHVLQGVEKHTRYIIIFEGCDTLFSPSPFTPQTPLFFIARCTPRHSKTCWDTWATRRSHFRRRHRSLTLGTQMLGAPAGVARFRKTG